jgi:phosphoribosyl 1,2-cyclic phosphate phosphodiesterase
MGLFLSSRYLSRDASPIYEKIMKGHLLFLGTGGSLGVPVIGCKCEACCSPSPYNKRTRSSVLVKWKEKSFLIDVGPDFRYQALRYQIQTFDGVLLTHAHHDHTAGIDDLRAIYYKKDQPLPVLLSVETAKDIQMRDYYMFNPTHLYDTMDKKLQLHFLPEAEGQIEFENVPLTYVSYEQGGLTVNGFRFGQLAYISDIRHFPATIFQYLDGVKTLIVSALKFTPSPLHFSVDEAVDFAHKVGAERTWLTHISHELEHEKANAYLPSNIQLAYDGLEIDFW